MDRSVSAIRSSLESVQHPMNAGVSCAYTWEKEMKEAIKMRYFMFGLDEGERFPQMACGGF